jgi:hypothetical protein
MLQDSRSAGERESSRGGEHADLSAAGPPWPSPSMDDSEDHTESDMSDSSAFAVPSMEQFVQGAWMGLVREPCAPCFSNLAAEGERPSRDVRSVGRASARSHLLRGVCKRRRRRSASCFCSDSSDGADPGRLSDGLLPTRLSISWKSDEQPLWNRGSSKAVRTGSEASELRSPILFFVGAET